MGIWVMMYWGWGKTKNNAKFVAKFSYYDGTIAVWKNAFFALCTNIWGLNKKGWFVVKTTYESAQF